MCECVFGIFAFIPPSVADAVDAALFDILFRLIFLVIRDPGSAAGLNAEGLSGE